MASPTAYPNIHRKSSRSRSVGVKLAIDDPLHAGRASLGLNSRARIAAQGARHCAANTTQQLAAVRLQSTHPAPHACCFHAAGRTFGIHPHSLTVLRISCARRSHHGTALRALQLHLLDGSTRPRGSEAAGEASSLQPQPKALSLTPWASWAPRRQRRGQRRGRRVRHRCKRSGRSAAEVTAGSGASSKGRE